MNNKLKTLGIVILSMVGVLLFFVVIIGIGNYFQNMEFNRVGTLIMLLFPVLVYFAVKIFNKKVNGIDTTTYGFGSKKFFQNSLLGMGLVIIMMTPGLIVGDMFFGIQIEFSGLKSGFGKPLLNLLTTFLIVGVWEEFFFRGLVLNTFLKNGFGFHLSALISSVLFSIFHWSSFDMTTTSWFWYIGIVLIGYIFAYIYTFTHSIWSVVSFHFIWDIVAELLDSSTNEIGLFEISNLAGHEKTSDNIEVVSLGIFLLLIIVLRNRMKISSRVQSYIDQLTTN